MNILVDSDTVFCAISDGVRRQILEGLAAGGEQSVNELVLRHGLSQPTMSKHLRVLREAGLVQVRTEHRFRYYTLRAEPLQPVLDWARYFEGFWTNRLDALGTHLRKRKR